MASAEGGLVPSGDIGEYPLPSRLWGLRECCELPQRDGRAPAKNGFWRVLKATESIALFVPI